MPFGKLYVWPAQEFDCLWLHQCNLYYYNE